MSKSNKFFRVVVEGATTDGRRVDRAMIEQMAKNYDPKYYCALINIDHLRGIHPESTFKRYGKILAAKSEEITEGKLKGKLALFAQFEPTDDLIALNKSKQKLFSSVEIATSFADTNEAYLVGLAVTDDPASLGTEILEFSAKAQNNPFTSRKQDPNNLFSSAEECELDLDFSEQDKSIQEKFTQVSETIKGLFSQKQGKDNQLFKQIGETLENLAELHKQASEETEQALSILNTEIAQLKKDITEAKNSLSKIPDSSQRPASTGGNTDEQTTDC